MAEIKKITRAQWTMIFITILSTIIINIIVSAVIIFMVSNHISKISLVDCQDRIYDHLTKRQINSSVINDGLK